jgi:hypothetical protein
MGQVTTIPVDYLYRILERLKELPYRVLPCGTRTWECRRAFDPQDIQKLAAIKIIIDWGLDQDNDFVIEFNSTYTRIRKFRKSLPTGPWNHLPPTNKTTTA